MHLLGLALLALAPAAAQVDDDEPPPTPRCTSCKHTGMLGCRDCKHKEPELERGVVYCSWKGDCETCLGAGSVDCGKCENEPAEEWLAERARSQAELRTKHEAAFDEEFGRPLLKCETDHFILIWDIEKQKIGKKLLSDHQAMHVYADRLEALFADFLAVFQAGEAEFPQKLRVMIWWLKDDQLRASGRFLDIQNEQGVKLLGTGAAYTVWGKAKELRDDEDLHRNIVHNVSHCLLSAQTPQLWIGNRKGGWADAGVAHLFEFRLDGLCSNYCYQEQNTMQDFKAGDWRKQVRKMVAKGDAPPVSQVFAQNTDTLTVEMHAVAFSYVDYLVQLDGAKASRLLRMMRGRTATRDAFRAVYAQTPLEFERAWVEWVLATYPKR